MLNRTTNNRTLLFCSQNFNSFRWMLLYLAVQINLCLCANLPDSITLIVPVNGSVYLGGPGTIVAATFGVNYTNTALQTGFVFCGLPILSDHHRLIKGIPSAAVIPIIRHSILRGPMAPIR